MIGRIVGVLENEPRTVVSIYYPSKAGTPIAGLDLYAPCRSEAGEALGELGVEPGRLAVADPIVAEGPFAIARDRLPVLIFSPGFGIERDMYQGVIAGLVARRFVVATVGAPDESVFTVFPDGTFIRQRPELSDIGDTDYGAWRHLLDRRGEWIIRTIRYLDHLNRKDEVLAGRLDLDRIAACGHSLGGAAAFEAAMREARIKAAVLLDPSFHLIRRDRESAPVPTLLLRQEASTREALTALGMEAIAADYIEGQRYAASAVGGDAFFRVTGASHLSFSDVPLHHGDEHALSVHAAVAACAGRFLESVLAGKEPAVDAGGCGTLVPIDADGEPIVPVPVPAGGGV